MTLAERIVDAAWRGRWLLLALLLPVLAVAAWSARDVGVDNAVDVWFVEDDPALVAYGAFQRDFGNDEVVALAVHDPDGILDAEGLARIAAVTRAAAATDGIAEVTSLTTIAQVRLGDADGLLPGEAPPLVVAPVAEGVEEDAAALRARVLEDPMLRNHLVSADGRTALVLARMGSFDDMDARRDGILLELERRVGEAAGEVPLAGIGVVYSALNRASSRDVLVVGTASYALILVLLWWLLGRIGSVLASLGVVSATAVVVMGLYGAAGRDLNMVTMALPTLLFVLCVEDAVHVLHAVRAAPGETRRQRIVHGVGAVFWPCLFTSLTTAAGFFALTSARMQVVSDLGLFAGIGVLVAFVLTLVVLVPALGWAATEPRDRSVAWLERAVLAVAELAMRWRLQVIAGAAVLALLGAWGVSRINADTYSIDYFYPSHPVRQHSAFIEEKFGPYVPLELVVESEASLRTPEALGAIAAWQDRMAADPDVGSTGSVADVARRLNQLLSEPAADAYVVPSDPAALEQALFVYESDPDARIDDLVDDRWRRVRVTVALRMMSARDIGASTERLVALANDPAWPQGAVVVPSGYLPLYVTMMDYVVRSQIDSFAIAFLAIFALIGVLFRSARMTLLAVPGNLLPVFATLGLMGVAGIRLDVATVTIAALVLGLVVNDTIHFLFRFRDALARSGDHEQAVRDTVRTTGVAIASTSLCLTLGFAVLALAQVKSVAFFGLLTAFAMASALVADLVLLPALLVVLRPRLDHG